MLPSQRLKNIVTTAGLIIAIGAACVCRAAFAAETYTIRRNIQTGLSYSFDLTQDSNMKSQWTVQGQSGKSDQAVHTHRVGTAQVMEMKDGNPSVVRVTFDRACETTFTNNGQKDSPPFPFAGKTIMVRRDASGNVTADGALDVDPAVLQELRVFTDPDVSFYPKGPVTVGQEWPGDPQALSAMFQLTSKDDSAGLTAKLLSVKDVNGRSTAEVKVSIACVKKDATSSFKQIMQGVLLVDLASGAVVQSDVKGPVSSSGEGQVQGPDGKPVLQKGSAEGTTEIHGIVKIQNAGAPGAVPAPPAPEAPPAAGAGALAGTYRSEKLTLDVKASGNGYAGTARLGEKSFPVNARDVGGKLQGYFESQGAKFDFTASIDGNDMTFVTGKSTYKLKKDADNPLDQPAAPNPLDQGK